MATKPGKKKPYRSPRLSVYGNLRRLTAFVTKKGNKGDGLGKPATRS